MRRKLLVTLAISSILTLVAVTVVAFTGSSVVSSASDLDFQSWGYTDGASLDGKIYKPDGVTKALRKASTAPNFPNSVYLNASQPEVLAVITTNANDWSTGVLAMEAAVNSQCTSYSARVRMRTVLSVWRNGFEQVSFVDFTVPKGVSLMKYAGSDSTRFTVTGRRTYKITIKLLNPDANCGAVNFGKVGLWRNHPDGATSES